MTSKVRRFCCPKYRRRVFGGRAAERLGELVRQRAAERGRETVAMEVVPDHVHLFVRQDSKSSVSYDTRREWV